MKKVLVFLSVLFLMSIGAYCLEYKYYSGTITGNTAEAILSVASDIGQVYAKGGVIKNDGVSNVLVSFCLGGSGIVYGDTIKVLSGEAFNFDVFPQYKYIKLTVSPTSDSVSYRAIVGYNKIATE